MPAVYAADVVLSHSVHFYVCANDSCVRRCGHPAGANAVHCSIRSASAQCFISKWSDKEESSRTSNLHANATTSMLVACYNQTEGMWITAAMQRRRKRARETRTFMPYIRTSVLFSLSFSIAFSLAPRQSRSPPPPPPLPLRPFRWRLAIQINTKYPCVLNYT